MALVKYREYEVGEGSLASVPLQVTVPVIWIRDHCQAGDKVGLYMDSENPGRLVIEVVASTTKASAAAELTSEHRADVNGRP